MKSTYQDNFDKAVAEWAAADAECRRLYSLWIETTQRAKRLARKKNEAFDELMGARTSEDGGIAT